MRLVDSWLKIEQTSEGVRRINSSGIRDTARVLKINKNTVNSTLKKSRAASSK
jgi:transposase-like protein